MTLRVIVRAEAKGDIREARKWYRKISPLLADDFVAAVGEAINTAKERPASFQVVIAHSGGFCFDGFRIPSSSRPRPSV